MEEIGGYRVENNRVEEVGMDGREQERKRSWSRGSNDDRGGGAIKTKVRVFDRGRRRELDGYCRFWLPSVLIHDFNT
jgi:hypothetical protein